VAILIGIAAALAVGAFGTITGLDRERGAIRIESFATSVRSLATELGS
jgi:hypothetical protein